MTLDSEGVLGRGVSIVIRSGAKPCFFRSFRCDRLADLAQRLG